MNKEEFRARLKTLGLTITEFSTLIGIDRSNVSLWGGPVKHTNRPSEECREFPKGVVLLLTAWEKHPSLLEEFIEFRARKVDGVLSAIAADQRGLSIEG